MLFVQPHFDDIAFSCGGLVAKEVAAGGAPMIVTVCSEGPPPSAELSALARRVHQAWGTGDRAIEVRRLEDATAVAALGAASHWLGYRDAIYRASLYPTPEQLSGPVHPDDAHLPPQLEHELLKLWSDTGQPAVYLPLAAGGNVDHRIAFAAGAALQAAGARVLHYEDVPYVMRVPNAVEDRVREAAVPLRPEVVDVTDTLERRLEAISAYTSQLATLFRGEQPRDLVQRYAGSLASSPGRYAERYWARVDAG
ncbi:MAG: LmbE family protein [Myxococcales bacterium]|nr:LmbE family protein [Myxococcales bacterium]